ncbi:MAG: CsbD family protein [Alphaproteobacteria bacterium]|nr:CsbD family protein [Alphaproteobacteria bacterium]
MNWDQIEGKWKQVGGAVKKKWGKLTDDELDQIDGNREILVGKLQEKYGVAKEEAEKQIADWERSL